MNRLLLALLLAPAAFGAGPSGDGGDPLIVQKWVNFTILASGIGYLVVKFGAPAIRSCQRNILDSIQGAARRAGEAEAKAAEIDRKVAGLESELVALREQSRAEMQAETARFEEDTRALLDKIRHQADLDIARARAEAVAELKQHAVRLAFDLARANIEARLTPETQSRLVAQFAAGLEERKN
jgi:F-type H+-transporting ATPase subunit b